MGTKQNDKSGIDTVLKDFPLFCPKCKLTHIIDVEKLEIVIKNLCVIGFFMTNSSLSVG